jgi:hypothetical protein
MKVSDRKKIETSEEKSSSRRTSMKRYTQNYDELRSKNLTVFRSLIKEPNVHRDMNAFR